MLAGASAMLNLQDDADQRCGQAKQERARKTVIGDYGLFCDQFP